MHALVAMVFLFFGAANAVLLAQSPNEAAADEPPVANAPSDGTAGDDDAAEGAGAAEEGGQDEAQDEAEDGAKDEAAGDADEETSAEGESLLSAIFSQGAIGYLIAGGPFMWPIVILGVVGGGVIIERYRSLQMLHTDTAALRAEVQSLLQADKVEEAYRLCDSQQGPVPAILTTGLRQFLVLRRLGYDPARIEEQVVKAMDDYGVHIVAALERHLPVLATISSIAPMIGFLGTVQGMIVAFDDIVRTMGETNIVAAAAAGIKVSLLTTLLGLVVGIPAFMAYNYFTSVINRFVLDVEESASELIEVVTLQMTMKERAAAETEHRDAEAPSTL